MSDGNALASAPSGVDRAALAAWYRRNRARSKALFDLLIDDAIFYKQPIALRHPLIFYEGHLPAFSFNTLGKSALGYGGIDADLETLFARGIDPAAGDSSTPDPDRNRERWPDRAVVQRFAREADARVL